MFSPSTDSDTDKEEARRISKRRVDVLISDIKYMRANSVGIRQTTQKDIDRIRSGGITTLSRAASLRVWRLWRAFYRNVLGKRQVMVATSSPASDNLSSIEPCPSPGDVLRFLSFMIQYTAPKGVGAGKPLLTTNKRIHVHLVENIHCAYQGFDQQHGTTEDVRTKAFLERMAYNGKLTGVRSVQQARFSFRLVQSLARSWLCRAMKEPCVSWDVVWLYLAAVVVRNACGVGDALTHRGCTRRYLRWRDVEMSMRPDAAPCVQSLRATITLSYMDEEDRTDQTAKTLFFDRSPDQGQSYASVIPVLMVLALRSGQVDGTSIDKVLGKLSKCDGQTIQWKYPERPVLSCGINFPLNECTMGSQHFERAIFRMGLVAGILEECKAQARRWAIMDGLNGVDSVMDAHKPTLAAAAVRKSIVDKWEAEEFGADPASDSGAVSPSSMDEEHCRWPIRLIDDETAPDDVDAHVLKALIGLVTVTPDVEDDRLARSDYNDAFIIAGYNHDYAARSKKKSQIDVALTKPADEFVQYFSSIRDG